MNLLKVTMKSDFHNKLEVNLYFIKSDFKDILVRIGKKIFEEKERFLVKFNKNHDLTEIDRYLWISEKDSFLPHQIFNESLSELDNFVLFKGSFNEMKKLKGFKKIIISPDVKITKFEGFEKFMLFSNEALTEDILKNIKGKLVQNKIEHKIYYEYNSFKWKLLN